MLNYDTPNTSRRRFNGYKTHPWEELPPPASPFSTAAGAYQVLASTWKELIDKGLIPAKGEKFSPLIQDRIAVIKLEDRGVLHLIRTGKIKEALEVKTSKGKPSLASEWTSLPGGSQNAHRLTADNKPMDMTYLLSLFEKYLSEEILK
ncbi:hypothetical protein [Uliginosibacterium sediminicola]|uniref:DUF4287 domain-containing protein n=1 Tax=Uliginosibacterium sediminicola TaxID=2024550 RepID=A0ABU9Z1J2_9RHOO